MGVQKFENVQNIRINGKKYVALSLINVKMS